MFSDSTIHPLIAMTMPPTNEKVSSKQTYRDLNLAQSKTNCMWGVRREVGKGWYYEAAVCTPSCIGALYYGSDGMSITVTWEGRFHRRSWDKTPRTKQGAVIRAASFIRKVTNS